MLRLHPGRGGHALPKNQALIRTSNSATLKDEDLDYILACFRRSGQALGIIK